MAYYEFWWDYRQGNIKTLISRYSLGCNYSNIQHYLVNNNGQAETSKNTGITELLGCGMILWFADDCTQNKGNILFTNNKARLYHRETVKVIETFKPSNNQYWTFFKHEVRVVEVT